MASRCAAALATRRRRGVPLLATILVANMLNNLFTQQIPQIGIMKAIGARSVRIGRLYLTMTLPVAMAATVLALAPAVLIGRGLANQIFGILGIQPASRTALVDVPGHPPCRPQPATSANILDRTREFGVMHAIGAQPKAVRRIVVAEGVFLALASCLAATIPALALTAGLGNLFMYAPLPYRISILAIGIWVALVVLGAVLATEAAATRASRITVREALTYL